MIVKTRFHSLLEGLVQEEIEKIKEEMADGIVDYPQYRENVGLIKGLRGALRLCEDLERDLE